VLPFHDSISGLPASPTAVQEETDRQAIATREVLPGALESGIVAMDHPLGGVVVVGVVVGVVTALLVLMGRGFVACLITADPP
jgi:hypothetical protein